MPRVTTVKKARKEWKCDKCGDAIHKGDPHCWWEFNFGPKVIRCSKSECQPKPADLTQSAYFQELYDIQAFIFTGGTAEDLTAEKDDIVDRLSTLRDEQEEKRDNMPEQLQDSEVGELLQQRYDELDEAVSSLEAVDIVDPVEEEDKADLDAYFEAIQVALEEAINSIG